MKRLRKLGLFILIVIITLGLMFALPKPKYQETNIWRKTANDNKVLVMAHGGGQGYYPSNTMSAFLNSYNLGVDVLEMDVQMTKDGILVLRHGENKTGNIKAMSNCDTVVWKENYNYLYETCNFGYNYQDEEDNYPYRDMTQAEWSEAKVYLTKLEELFIEFGDTILYNIEIKADADAPRTETADVLYELLAEYGLLEETLVATAFDDISKYIVENYPEITLSTSQKEAQNIIIPAYTFTSIFYTPDQYAAVQIPVSFNLPVINELNLATRLLINTLHRHNMAVHYWTINDPDEMRTLIELGADGIITDYPDVLQNIIKEYE
ncbi:MAG: glycerophosphodiester phosphodiesterase family protein [Candidatus Izemoplasmatales bacterium]|nr:glycerophosphodiester phosphodiesterase family protein [Candidatus Izemoplasmatales bacterium]